METKRIEIGPKTILSVIGAVGACVLLLRLTPIVVVVIVAWFLVAAFGPVVDWLQMRGLSRGLAVAASWILALIAATLFAILTLPSLFDQVRSLVEHEPDIRNHLADTLSKTKLTQNFAQSLRDFKYDALTKQVGPQVLVASGRVLEFVGYTVSALFLAIYFMIDRDRLRGGLFALVPRDYHVRLARVLINLETIVGGYIRGQVLTSVLMAAFTFVLLLACGVPNPLALAAFAGAADVLPYIGAALAIAPCAAATAASRGLVQVLIVVGVMLAYQEFESRVIVPRVYGRVLRLPSSMVLLALLVGGVLGGVIGALLSLPVASALRMLFQEARTILPGERVEDSALRERDARAEREYHARAQDLAAEEAAAVAVEIAFGRLQEEGGRKAALDVPMTAAHH